MPAQRIQCSNIIFSISRSASSRYMRNVARRASSWAARTAHLAFSRIALAINHHATYSKAASAKQQARKMTSDGVSRNLEASKRAT